MPIFSCNQHFWAIKTYIVVTLVRLRWNWQFFQKCNSYSNTFSKSTDKLQVLNNKIVFDETNKQIFFKNILITNKIHELELIS